MSLQKRPLTFFFAVGASLCVAILFSIFPKPELAYLIQPELVSLMVIYWVVYFPQYLGLGFAALTGLVQDVVEQSVWGSHMAGLVVMAYICLMSYHRIASYRVWQQMAWVAVLVSMGELVSTWLRNIEGYEASLALIFLTVVSSSLCWPLVFIAMRKLQLKPETV